VLQALRPSARSVWRCRTLMLAATGWVTSCPMIGFEIEGSSAELITAEDHVMGPMWHRPRAPRTPPKRAKFGLETGVDNGFSEPWQELRGSKRIHFEGSEPAPKGAESNIDLEKEDKGNEKIFDSGWPQSIEFRELQSRVAAIDEDPP